jgi:hypothetical protein
MASSIWTVVVLPLVPVTASQLDLAPHGDSALAGLGDEGGRRLPAGRDDEELGVVGEHRRRALAQPDVGTEHAEQLGLLLLAVGPLVERDDRGTEVGEVVGRGEPADPEAGHHGTHPGPVVVAPERRDVLVHARATQAA